MDSPGEADTGALGLDFDRRLLLRFRGSTITTPLSAPSGKWAAESEDADGRHAARQPTGAECVELGQAFACFYADGLGASLRGYVVKGGFMSVGRLIGKTSQALAVGAAILAATGLTTVPRPAEAYGGWGGGGGISPGAAVGLGLGAFALGSVLSNPYNYNPYYYGGYPPAAAYYPPSGYYPPARSCWNPYYRNYYPC